MSDPPDCVLAKNTANLQGATDMTQELSTAAAYAATALGYAVSAVIFGLMFFAFVG
jgi:hypothetical protein